VTYDDASSAFLPPGESKWLSRYTIKVPTSEVSLLNAGLAVDVRITWNLDKNGFVYIQSAQLLEEIAASASDDSTTAVNPIESKEGDANANKKRFKKIDLEVVAEYPGLTKNDVKEAIELEASMAFEDKLIVETADKRNELESYLYTMRDKVDGPLKNFGKKDELEKLKSLMNNAEDWLYNDGYETTKNHYQRKIDELKVLGNVIESRHHESTQRPGAIDSLKKQLDMCKAFAANYDEARSHITEEERSKLRKEVQQTEAWMYDMITKQGNLADSFDPIFTLESINSKRNSLFNFSNPIMSRQKPKPVVVEPETKTPPTTSNNSGDKTEESTPMDQSKGGPDSEKK